MFRRVSTAVMHLERPALTFTSHACANTVFVLNVTAVAMTTIACRVNGEDLKDFPPPAAGWDDFFDA